MSGVPSTAWALATGADPLAATRAAGTLVGRRDVASGVAVHSVLSVLWGAAVAAAVGRVGCRRVGTGALLGAACGAAIAAFDLEVIGRRFPEIAALPRVPQWLDHLVFGMVVGALSSPGTPTSPRRGAPRW